MGTMALKAVPSAGQDKGNQQAHEGRAIEEYHAEHECGGHHCADCCSAEDGFDGDLVAKVCVHELAENDNTAVDAEKGGCYLRA